MKQAHDQMQLFITYIHHTRGKVMTHDSLHVVAEKDHEAQPRSDPVQEVHRGHAEEGRGCLGISLWGGKVNMVGCVR